MCCYTEIREKNMNSLYIEVVHNKKVLIINIKKKTIMNGVILLVTVRSPMYLRDSVSVEARLQYCLLPSLFLHPSHNLLLSL